MLINTMHNNVLLLVYLALPAADHVSGVCIFGPECFLPCRCQDEQCHPETGICASSCSDNSPLSVWSGPGCQIGNIAYGKTRLHTNSGISGDTSVTVDGDHTNTCLFINTMDIWNNPSWTVDFERIYAVQSVSIYSELLTGYDDQFIAKYKVEVSNVPDFSSSIRCGIYEGPLPTGENVTIQCQGKLLAKYLKVVRLAVGSDVDPRPAEFHLCEVVVIGHEYIDVDCDRCAIQSNDSSDFCGNGIWCEECQPGFQSPDCREAARTETSTRAVTTRHTTSHSSETTFEAAQPSSPTTRPPPQSTATSSMASQTSHVVYTSDAPSTINSAILPHATSSATDTEPGTNSTEPTAKNDQSNSDTSTQLIIYTVVAIVAIVLVTVIILGICLWIRRRHHPNGAGETPNGTLSRRQRNIKYHGYNNHTGKGYPYDEEYAVNLSRHGSLRSVNIMDTIHEEKEKDSSKHSSCSSLHENSVKTESTNNLNGSIKRYSNRSL